MAERTVGVRVAEEAARQDRITVETIVGVQVEAKLALGADTSGSTTRTAKDDSVAQSTLVVRYIIARIALEAD